MKIHDSSKKRGSAHKNTPSGLSDISNSRLKNQGQKDVTEGASSWYNPHNGIAGKIQIYENELRIITPKRQVSSSPPPKRKESDIHTFSRKSRIRVLHKFNRLQTKVLSAPIFGTCTARHNSLSPEEFQYKFLKEFLPQLQKIIPNLVYAWRLEPHKDGYPHYHWFAWSWDQERNLNSQYYKRKIRSLWKSIIDDNSYSAGKYACKIVGVKSFRKAMAYVSKYMCKEDDEKAAKIRGRRWAVSTNFPASPITEISLSKKHLDKLKKVAKAFCWAKGGHLAKSVDYLDSDGEWFLWIGIDEIIELLSGCDSTFVPSSLEWYKSSGKNSPPDAFFEEYSDQI